MEQKTILQQLAHFVASLDFSDLPQEVVSKANDAWFDLMGCYLAALNNTPNPKLIQYALASNPLGEATLWGTGVKASLDATVMTEGYIGYSLEFDDGVSLGGHWGSASIPVALACTEISRGEGKNFLLSIVCAYEVGTRLSRRFAPHMLNHKIHFPCAMGAFAAAGAAAKAYELDARTIASGLANGCLSPIGPYGTAVSGESIKNMYSGWPNLVGLKMIEFAKLGLGGDIDSFESENGLAVAFRGEALTSTEEELALNDLGKRYSLMESYFKPYPCCRWLHAPLALIQKIMREHPGKSIRTMTVSGPQFLHLYDTKGDFTKKVKAQYSIPFTLGAFACCGKLGIDEFESPTRTRKDIEKMADSVRIVLDPSREQQFPSKFSVGLEVGFCDGSSAHAEGGLPWSPNSPATKQELMQKFTSLVSPFMSKIEVNSWLSLYQEGVEKEGNFGKLLLLLGKDHLQHRA